MALRPLIVLLAIGFAIWLWKKRYTHNQIKRRQQPQPSTLMLRCDDCGTHFPENTGIKTRHGVYCCKEHERRARSRSSS